MKKKILIVEDERALSKMLKNKLERYGFQVICSFDGKNALKKIKSVKLDLILLDILIPKKNGFSVLTEVREIKELNQVIIIMLSNLGQKTDIKKAKKLGANDYIIKSNLSIQEIVEKINKFIK